MALYLKQRFTTGRFHATRWAENPPADAYGEWPPSPWRLSRALAAIWFNGGHQSGISMECIRSLLLKLTHNPPQFWLPPSARRAGPTKHFQPTDHGWDEKQPKDKREKGTVKVLSRTLVEDHFISLPSDEPIWWIWENLSDGLQDDELSALGELCRRMRYFGRAESLCELEREEKPPAELQPNAKWSSTRFAGCRPVLCPIPKCLNGERGIFEPEHLLEPTGDMLGRGAKIPAGATWLFYNVPERPRSKPVRRTFSWPSNLHCIQFALGGRVWPTPKFIVSVAESFRRSALKRYAVLQNGNPEAKFDPQDLSVDQWSLNLSGKHHPDDGGPRPAKDHLHAYYLPRLDAAGRITGLVVWSRTAFTQPEIEALLLVERLDWGSGRYPLRAVPLPLNAPLPRFLRPDCTARVWTNGVEQGGTPFVPPRFAISRSGKVKRGQSPVEQLRDLLNANGIKAQLIANQGLDPTLPESSDAWVRVHPAHYVEGSLSPRPYRPCKTSSVKLEVLPGPSDSRRSFGAVRLEFDVSIADPLLVGHSAHFGLGQFVPLANEESSRQD